MTVNKNFEYVKIINKQSQEAFKIISGSSSSDRNLAIFNTSSIIKKNQNEILKANDIDIKNAKAKNLSNAFIDRLILDNKRIKEIAKSQPNFKDAKNDYSAKNGDLVVLDKLNLEIKKNEMVSIIGPSGSGKTTVLRVLMTLEKINQGVIHLDGEPLTHMDKDGSLIEASEKYLRERRSKIGMVFQQFNLFPHMTALQNCIEAPIEVLGMKKEEAEERALELLELVGLTDKKDQHPSRLSGGQQQRVAIARALAMRPKVMLLDEITSALDPEVVGEVLNVIRSLNKEHSLTMIMVTHQMGFAREISDRVCFFNEGKIFEQGPPEKLFGDPQNERTKQFLHAVLDAN